MEFFGKIWRKYPLISILVIALIPRLVAAFYAKGYAMHDDHFTPIEFAYEALNNPSMLAEKIGPVGNTPFYAGSIYATFWCAESVGITDPQDKMLIVRLLHALYSLLTVYFAYKIAEVIADRESARKVGLVLGLFWLMPYFSVRNLIEIVCLPPLMAGMYYSVKNRDSKASIFFAGIMFAAAFIFRMQTAVIPFAMGLVLAWKKDFARATGLYAGFAVGAFLLAGIPDWIFKSYPFATFAEYFIYNAANGSNYTSGPPWQYLILLLGVFLPPMGTVWLAEALTKWKRYALLFIPVFAFFLFHSLFPNKQERFILPIVPALVVLGICGFEYAKSVSGFWLRKRKMLKGFTVTFWILNTILLLVFTFTYGKKTRCETLYYLSKKSDVSAVIVPGGNIGDNYPPAFYLNKFSVPIYTVSNDCTAEEIRKTINPERMPNYAIFFGKENLTARAEKLARELGKEIRPEQEIDPSLIDDILYKLNPEHNKNQSGFVFKLYDLVNN